MAQTAHISDKQTISPKAPHEYSNLLDCIGNTPLVKVPFDVPATILAKLEYFNPGGSVKDRSALFMIQEAEQKGWLQPGGTIIDASSGNQGIATAMIGAIKGYKVIISVSDKISQEKLQTLKSFGAEVVIHKSTATLEDPNSYHSKAVELHKNTPNSFMPNQYFNLSNAQAHYTLLGPEIWQQTDGSITHLFAATGTGGHCSGSGRYLKEKKSSVKVVAVDSVNSWHATNGNPKPYKLEGIGIDFSSPIFDKKTIDEIATVTDDDAIAMLKKFASEFGLLIGPSSGAVASAVYKYAKKLTANDTVVMVFGDSGRAYLTKNFY